jgi:hypothetical protein
LNLIADNEIDPVRAEAARADAVTARHLAEGMAAAHTAQVGQPAPVPPSTAGYDTAAETPEVVELPGAAALPDVVELADVVGFDGLEVGL